MNIDMEKVNRIASQPMNLKIFATLTQQEVFDYGVACLIKQGTLAYSEHYDRCFYNLDIGGGKCLHCFAGFFIGDAYDEKMDLGQGEGWLNLVTNWKFPEVHRAFMQDMQNTHDRLAQEVEDINEQTIAKWFKRKTVLSELEWHFDTDDDGNVTGGGYY